MCLGIQGNVGNGWAYPDQILLFAEVTFQNIQSFLTAGILGLKLRLAFRRHVLGFSDETPNGNVGFMTVLLEKHPLIALGFEIRVYGLEIRTIGKGVEDRIGVGNQTPVLQLK